MTKLSPHIWLSRIVISVGIIGACMAAMQAAWSLYLLRLLLGVVEAGLWPGMTFYLTLFYPPERIGKRIGMYFTAAQVSAAVVGLVSAGFQKMDGMRGLVGFQWMFLVYGLVTVVVGFGLLWWLPGRPIPPHHHRTGEPTSKWGIIDKWMPTSPPALKNTDAEIHFHDLNRVYHHPSWSLRDLLRVFLDWRLYPLLIMYFGVVGVGIGVQNYATVILHAIDPGLSGIELSLLSAPIWIVSPLPFHIICIQKLINTDGLNSNPPNNPPLRPLPSPPSPILHSPHNAPNPRSPINNLFRHIHKPLASLRRPPNNRIWSRPHRPRNNDLDNGNLPTASWRGRRSSCFGGCFGSGQFGQCGYYLCAL